MNSEDLFPETNNNEDFLGILDSFDSKFQEEISKKAQEDCKLLLKSITN